MKRILEPVIFGLVTLPVVYIAMSRGLEGDFVLSFANTKFAGILGLTIGAGVGLVILPFQFSKKPIVWKVGRIIVCIVEAAVFGGVYLWTAAVASC